MSSTLEVFQTALQHHQAGRLPEAESLCRQILQAQPVHPDALHLLGVIAHQAGRNDVAIDLLGRAIAANPAAAEFHNHLAVAYQAQGCREEALAHFRQAITLRPAFAEAYYNLGLMLQREGRLEEAQVQYREALRLKPEYADAWNNLGNILRTQGKLEEAITLYRQALVLQPAYGEAHINLGIVLQEQGQIDEAMAHYREALRLKPVHANAWNNLGSILRAQGQLEEAVAAYQQAQALEPTSAQVYYNLGAVFHDQDKVGEAITHYRQALVLNPTLAQAHISLGDVLKDEGITEEAEACYRQAFAIQPSDGLKIKLATMLPVILPSVQDVATIRKRFEENVDALLKEELTLKDPIKEVWQANFYLAYQGYNDRELQTRIARLYERACPSLLYTAPHCRAGLPAVTGRKLRVGFISRFFGNHSIGNLMRGIIAELSRREFSVIVMSFPRKPDDFSVMISHCADRSIVVPPTLEAARQRIAEEQLDILFYTDIGMDPLTYFLAFSRLAPVQCTSVGHGVTTGIRTIDYFISSEDLEPEHADQHYSERLVRLTHLPTYYYRPGSPGTVLSRRELGLDESRTLYVCPQSLFKIHPDFDEVLAGILQADPRGEVILIEGVHPNWTELLMRRFRTTIPEGERRRIRFVPRQSRQGFHSLVTAADVILDPLHCGGGNTTLDAFPTGIPIVTLPGEFMRGRTTSACYKQMGVLDCIATTTGDYVKRAVRLGTDRVYRAEVQAKILATHGVLYENAEAVRELERFFLAALEASRVPIKKKASSDGGPKKRRASGEFKNSNSEP